MSCVNNVRTDRPAREEILCTERWRVCHAFGTSLPGWLVVVPLRHVTAIDELDEGEAAELGVVLREASLALKEVTGCTKTYVAQFAEAEGFSHVHFHLVPRLAEMPHEHRGPRVFSLLGVSAEDAVSDDEADALALKLSAALPPTLRARQG